jgi:UDP-glucose 4-epimerase
MKALITGGAGYIGSTVAHFLIDQGHQVAIIDNLSTGDKKNVPKKAIFYKFDISDTKKIKRILAKNSFDVVFHFAAFINNEESIRYPKKYYKNNFSKGKIFFENCINNKINKFIYSSTAAVYGNKNKHVDEKDSLQPMSPYPKSKLKLEKFLIKNKKNISCVILRYFNVAGADKKLRCGFNVKNGYNLILNLCVSSLKKKEFIINGNNYGTKDGTPIRDYIHVQDLAKIHLLSADLVLKKKIFEIFNCGYGYGFSVQEILQKFKSISKNKIKYKIGKRRKSDIVISISNPNKLIRMTKWKPRYNSLTQVLKSSFNWYKKMSIRKIKLK